MAREFYPASFYTRSLKAHPLFSMQKELSKLFDDLVEREPISTTSSEVSFSPRLDAHETEKEFLVSIEIPGINENDVEVSIKDKHLYVHGEKKSSYETNSEGKKYIERSYGKFERIIALPENAVEEEIDAVFKNGVLEVRIQKKVPELPKHKKIEIRTS